MKFKSMICFKFQVIPQSSSFILICSRFESSLRKQSSGNSCSRSGKLFQFCSQSGIIFGNFAFWSARQLDWVGKFGSKVWRSTSEFSCLRRENFWKSEVNWIFEFAKIVYASSFLQLFHEFTGNKLVFRKAQRTLPASESSSTSHHCSAFRVFTLGGSDFSTMTLAETNYFIIFGGEKFP